MSDKLAVILLDALGPSNIYDHNLLEGFEWLRGAYKRNGDVLGISTLPHTAQSNPMIWGGFFNANKFWVEPQDSEEWIDPAVLFEHRGKKHNRDDADEYRNYDRTDFDQSFVWDVLDDAGLDPVALQVPICLPPYSYNAERVDQEAWFPDTTERMAEHIRVKPELIEHHAEQGYDFIGTSIQMPDKWYHGIPEGKCDQSFVRDEAYVLDQWVERLTNTLEAEGYDWLLAGDHGSPCPGRMPVHAAKCVLPRHRKEAVVIGSEGLDLPRYTADMYRWMLDYFDVEDRDVDPDLTKSVSVTTSTDDEGGATPGQTTDDGPGEGGAEEKREVDEVTERMENLGYL